MKNQKKALLLILIIFLGFFVYMFIKFKYINTLNNNSQSNVNTATDSNVKKYSALENNNPQSSINTATGANLKKYSAPDLYKELVPNKNIDFRIFVNFVSFFNEGKFDKTEYIFFDKFNNNIQDNGKIHSTMPYTFLNNKNKILNSLNSFNSYDIGKYKKSSDIILDFQNIFKYTKGTTIIDSPFYYNSAKDYFFNLKNFNDINGICNLFSGNFKFFYDSNSGEKLTYDGTNINNYKKIDSNMLLSDVDYNIFINSDKKINDGLFVYKGLLNIVNKYVNNGYKEELKDLFYKKFDQQLSIYYTYSEYTLFFAMKKYEGKIDNTYCDNFMKEYFMLNKKY